MSTADFIKDVLNIGAAIPTPLALAGFGVACAFILLFFLLRKLRAPDNAPEVYKKYVIDKIYRFAITVVILAAITVIAIAIFNLWVPVHSAQQAIITQADGPDVPPHPPGATQPPDKHLPPASALTADSGWIPGGRDPVSYCNAQRAALAAQYPEAKIEEVQHYEFPPQKQKNFLGIVTAVRYRYHCAFKAE